MTKEKRRDRIESTNRKGAGEIEEIGVREARKTASERLRGKNARLTAVCFLSDIAAVASVCLMCASKAAGALENAAPWAIAVACITALAVWIITRALFGDFKRRAFERVLKNRAPALSRAGVKVYLVKYLAVLASSLGLFIGGVAVNASSIYVERVGGSVANRFRQSRLKSSGLVKKAVTMTTAGIYKIALPALAVLGTVNICARIGYGALSAVIAALSAAVIFAALELFYCRYKAALAILAGLDGEDETDVISHKEGDKDNGSKEDNQDRGESEP